MKQPELLEHIAQSMRENPDGWWWEFVFYMGMGEFVEFESAEQLWNAVRDGIETHPKRIPIHGWVDAEVIEWAKNMDESPGLYEPGKVKIARALLECVEKSDD